MLRAEDNISFEFSFFDKIGKEALFIVVCKIPFGMLFIRDAWKYNPDSRIEDILGMIEVHILDYAVWRRFAASSFEPKFHNSLKDR